VFKKLNDGTNPALTAASEETVKQMFVYSGRAALRRVTQKPIPTKEEIRTIVGAQTVYIDAALRGITPISDLPGPLNGVPHYVTVMMGGADPQPDGKPGKIYPGWGSKGFAADVHQGFFAKIIRAPFSQTPKPAAPQP